MTIKLTRIREWQSALASVIEPRMTVPFAWGTQDCCMFAADCVHAMTGTDPAADGRGQYDDEKSGVRYLQKLGGLASIAEQRLGEEVGPTYARPGDIVLGKIDRECLGVCTGEVWHAPSRDGLVVSPMSTALRAWRV